MIDLDALRHNYQLARELSGARALAVVKADAYGHGALRCAQALESEADGFAVACIEEALVLREAGIRSPILLLEGFFEADELALIERHRREALELVPDLLDDRRELAGLQSADDEHPHPAEREHQQGDRPKEEAGFEEALFEDGAVQGGAGFECSVFSFQTGCGSGGRWRGGRRVRSGRRPAGATRAILAVGRARRRFP